MHGLFKLHVCKAFYTHAFQLHLLTFEACDDHGTHVRIIFAAFMLAAKVPLKIFTYFNKTWEFTTIFGHSKIFSHFKTNTYTIQYSFSLTDMNTALKVQLWMEQVVENSLNWSCSM